MKQNQDSRKKEWIAPPYLWKKATRKWLSFMKDGGGESYIRSFVWKNNFEILLKRISLLNKDPRSSKELHEGTYYDLGVLKSTSGTQIYEVPEDMVEKINTAAIYCKPFKVIFGLLSIVLSNL